MTGELNRRKLLYRVPANPGCQAEQPSSGAEPRMPVGDPKGHQIRTSIKCQAVELGAGEGVAVHTRRPDNRGLNTQVIEKQNVLWSGRPLLTGPSSVARLGRITGNTGAIHYGSLFPAPDE